MTCVCVGGVWVWGGHNQSFIEDPELPWVHHKDTMREKKKLYSHSLRSGSDHRLPSEKTIFVSHSEICSLKISIIVKICKRKKG